MDTIDNILGDAIRMFVGTLAQIIGAIVLVSIVQPYFLIAVTVILVAYYWVGIYYRPSAREIRVRIHSKVHFCYRLKNPNSVWTHYSDRRSMPTFLNPLTAYPRFELTERPRGSAPKMLLGWISRIGVWLRFVKSSRTDGRSEVPTGCPLRLNDGSVFGWISSELYYSLQSLSWLSPPDTPSLLQRPASFWRTLSLPSKPSAG